jgi:hypothetical protein
MYHTSFKLGTWKTLWNTKLRVQNCVYCTNSPVHGLQVKFLYLCFVIGYEYGFIKEFDAFHPVVYNNIEYKNKPNSRPAQLFIKQIYICGGNIFRLLSASHHQALVWKLCKA